jgi:hypothetical protein
LLDLIHYDVFCLVKFPLISKALYYVSFSDDYFRRTWVYFLITKYKVFSWFKEFKSLLESQTSRKIKVLRTDNSGDFCSIEFDKKIKENGIERHKKNPYSH